MSRAVPAALKVLRGNPGKGPAPGSNPELAPLEAAVPAELVDPAARAEWARLVPALVAAGQVTVGDRAVVLAYCQAYGRWAALEAAAAGAPPTIETATGRTIANPLYPMVTRALEVLTKTAAAIGLTPAARSHVGTVSTTRPAAAEKWAGILP